MLRFLFGVRYLNVVAVVSLLVGTAAMLFVGAYHVYEALYALIVPAHPEINESTVLLIESLDSFILSIILLYFAYSIYFLFLRSDKDPEGTKNVPLPEWLKVEGLGEMKKTVLQVTVVALSLFWLRIVMIQTTEFQWTDLVLPASILAIAGAVRIMKLDHG
ncbi:MAG: YqhA family protein [Gemmatimonadota bacterium]|nr:YqhA family protein [Gemmatimonadota bacterium]